jgi:single-strand DNA-binding protein
MARETRAKNAPALPIPGSNEVKLEGRLAAEPEERELPSGDRLVQLRIIVPRDLGSRRPTRAVTPGASARRLQTVDTIDLVCWTAATRRRAARLAAGDQVAVEGALRRRFFGGPGGRQSRYEVEVAHLRRVSGVAARAT